MEMKNGFEIKPSLSNSLKELISRLLTIDPEERITLQEVMGHSWVVEMTDLLNNSLRKADVSSAEALNVRISELNALSKPKKRHQKTESASQIHIPKDKSININFLINNYSMLKKT